LKKFIRIKGALWDIPLIELTLPYEGYKGVILQNHLGNLNGYVGVPLTHVLSGLDYDSSHPILEKYKTLSNEEEKSDIPFITLLLTGSESTISNTINVHGGITFAGPNLFIRSNSGSISKYGIDHWWFGFDTCHAGDKILNLEISISLELKNYLENWMKDFLGLESWQSLPETYKDVVYVEDQIHKLAKQLHEIDFLSKDPFSLNYLAIEKNSL
jgi:hypothetical protein